MPTAALQSCSFAGKRVQQGASEGAHLVVVWELRGKEDIASVRRLCHCAAGCCSSQAMMRHPQGRRSASM
jgi:hypothetical protein